MLLKTTKGENTMTFNDFHEKLEKFFSDRQIETLDNSGADITRRFFEKENIVTSEDTIRDIGRDAVCELIAHYVGESYVKAAEKIHELAGGEINLQMICDIDAQIQLEW
jgi:hypothetical protein